MSMINANKMSLYNTQYTYLHVHVLFILTFLN